MQLSPSVNLPAIWESCSTRPSTWKPMVKSVCRSAVLPAAYYQQDQAHDSTESCRTTDSCLRYFTTGHLQQPPVWTPWCADAKNCKWSRIQLGAWWPRRENTTISLRSFNNWTGFQSRNALFSRSSSWQTRLQMALLRDTLLAYSSSIPKPAVSDLLVNTCFLFLGPASTTVVIEPFRRLCHDYMEPPVNSHQNVEPCQFIKKKAQYASFWKNLSANFYFFYKFAFYT